MSPDSVNSAAPPLRNEPPAKKKNKGSVLAREWNFRTERLVRLILTPVAIAVKVVEIAGRIFALLLVTSFTALTFGLILKNKKYSLFYQDFVFNSANNSYDALLFIVKLVSIACTDLIGTFGPATAAYWVEDNVTEFIEFLRPQKRTPDIDYLAATFFSQYLEDTRPKHKMSLTRPEAATILGISEEAWQKLSELAEDHEKISRVNAAFKQKSLLCHPNMIFVLTEQALKENRQAPTLEELQAKFVTLSEARDKLCEDLHANFVEDKNLDFFAQRARLLKMRQAGDPLLFQIQDLERAIATATSQGLDPQDQNIFKKMLRHRKIEKEILELHLSFSASQSTRTHIEQAEAAKNKMLSLPEKDYLFGTENTDSFMDTNEMLVLKTFYISRTLALFRTLNKLYKKSGSFKKFLALRKELNEIFFPLIFSLYKDLSVLKKPAKNLQAQPASSKKNLDPQVPSAKVAPNQIIRKQMDNVSLVEMLTICLKSIDKNINHVISSRQKQKINNI